MKKMMMIPISNKLANQVLEDTMMCAIKLGMTLSEFKKKFRPEGDLGKPALDMAKKLGLTDDNSPPSTPPLSPMGALKRSKKRSKKKSKSKFNMRRRSGSKLSKSERRSGKVRKKRTKRHKCKCKVCKCKVCKCKVCKSKKTKRKSRSKSRSKRQ